MSSNIKLLRALVLSLLMCCGLLTAGVAYQAQVIQRQLGLIRVLFQDSQELNRLHRQELRDKWQSQKNFTPSKDAARGCLPYNICG